MELLIIFIIFLAPAVVGYLSGMTGSSATVIRSETMNSKMVNETQNSSHTNFFESEHETHGWKPAPLSHDSQVPATPEDQQLAPIIPEVSSLPPEVENGLKSLMNELGLSADEGTHPVVMKEEWAVSTGHSFHQMADSSSHSEQYDIDHMLDTINESDIPPPISDNLVVFPGQDSPLPAKEYNAIRRVYGMDYADQITTTPALGATDSDIDVMMGRVNFSTDGTILLTYNNTSISIRGVGITPDLDGEVVLVKGFFIDSDSFMVDETISNSAVKQEVR